MCNKLRGPPGGRNPPCWVVPLHRQRLDEAATAGAVQCNMCFGTQSLGCAGQTVRPSLHSTSQTSAGKLSVLSYSVSVLMFDVRGSCEAIPSEPPSLAHYGWRAMGAQRGGGHPLGGPERTFVTRHRRRSSADRRDRGRERP